MLNLLKELYTVNKQIRYFHFSTGSRSGFHHQVADYTKFSSLLDTLTEVNLQTGLVNKFDLANLESTIPELEDDSFILTDTCNRVSAVLSSLNNFTSEYRQVNKVLDDVAEFLSILLYKLENLT